MSRYFIPGKSALLAIAAAILSGCLSGGGGSSDNSSTGVFIDSPVSGLAYATPSRSGRTNARGAFRYLPGESVSFSVAGINLGSAEGQAVITPLSLADSEDSADPLALNIARFLQALDTDGNLNNGIQISEETVTAIEELESLNPGFHLDFADATAFEASMTAEEGLLTHLNSAEVFAENSQGGLRSLRTKAQAWQHLRDNQDDNVDFSKRPVIFVHGGAGSASQFESQAQRFIANGYPRSHLATYEYNTNPPDFTQTSQQLDALIDQVLRSTGASQVDLMGHSMGTEVSRRFLADTTRAAKIANYVNLDGAEGLALFGGKRTLALWGQYVTRKIDDAENVYPTEEDPVGHIEVATSAESFERIYRFFNSNAAPATTQIPEAEGDYVWIAGRANIFPANVGAAGTVLEINEVDPTNGRRLSGQPTHRQAIDTSGHWGPFRVIKGASYEFTLLREGIANADHYFYREPYLQDNGQIRLNTSAPGTGVGALLSRSAGHSNLSISRDMELWGDQGDRNDSLTVNSTPVVTSLTGPLLQRLSNIFLHDRNNDKTSNLTIVDEAFHRIPFMSGLDLYLPATTDPQGIVRIELTSRRGSGEPQVINVPNWPSSQIRSISVHFRDYN